MKLDSSDEEDLQEEENEVVRLQKEKAGSLSVADFGIEDLSGNERDQELSLEVSLFFLAHVFPTFVIFSE